MTASNSNYALSFPDAMPDGRGGFQPVPALLTESEAIWYLRLDIEGPAKPENTLRYYRQRGKLKATQVGKHIRYTRKALQEFLEKMTND